MNTHESKVLFSWAYFTQFSYCVMDGDFCENLANGEPTSHGGQLLDLAEAKLSGDNEAL